MTDTTTDTVQIAASNWKTPTLDDWLAANPHLLNHSSRKVVDPEVPVSVNPNASEVESSD